MAGKTPYLQIYKQMWWRHAFLKLKNLDKMVLFPQKSCLWTWKFLLFANHSRYGYTYNKKNLNGDSIHSYNGGYALCLGEITLFCDIIEIISISHIWSFILQLFRRCLCLPLEHNFFKVRNFILFIFSFLSTNRMQSKFLESKQINLPNVHITPINDT